VGVVANSASDAAIAEEVLMPLIPLH